MLASCRSYEEAQRIVQRLGEVDFPVERVSIVARGLKWDEEIGRRDYAQAGLDGFASGLAIGAATGLVLAFVGFRDSLLPSSLGIALWGGMLGALLGPLIGLLEEWLRRRARGSPRTRKLHVSRYEVVAELDVAARARAELERYRFQHRDELGSTQRRRPSGQCPAP